MRQFPILITLALTICLTQYSLAQTSKSEKQLTLYLQELKSTKIDTILIIKSGCTGCEVKYKDTSKSVTDGQTIYILIISNGHFKLSIFDDIHEIRAFTLDTCTLFEFISQNKERLRQKEVFYKRNFQKSNPSLASFLQVQFTIHMKN